MRAVWCALPAASDRITYRLPARLWDAVLHVPAWEQHWSLVCVDQHLACTAVGRSATCRKRVAQHVCRTDRWPASYTHKLCVGQQPACSSTTCTDAPFHYLLRYTPTQVTLGGFLPCPVLEASPRRLACRTPALLGAMKAEFWRTPGGSYVNLDAYGEPGGWRLLPRGAVVIPFWIAPGSRPGFEPHPACHPLQALACLPRYLPTHSGHTSPTSFPRLVAAELTITMSLPAFVSSAGPPGMARPSNYGFRLTGYLRAPAAGSYTFLVSVDDVARVFVNNVAVGGATWGSAQAMRVALVAGYNKVVAHVINAGGPAAFNILWDEGSGNVSGCCCC